MCLLVKNKKEVAEPSPGDLIEFDRGMYNHWGVYVGDGDIVHLSGVEDDGINARFNPRYSFSIAGRNFNKARVCREKLMKVAGDRKAWINNDSDKCEKYKPLSKAAIVAKALSQLGDVGYNVIVKNCENFANWCRYGIAFSKQVDNALTGLAVVGGAALAIGFIAGVVKLFSGDTEKEEDQEQ